MKGHISTIDLFNLLREKIGEQQAQALTDYIQQRVEKRFEEAKTVLATQEDIQRVDGNLQKSVTDLRVEIRESKAEMIKWMFIFWMGQIAAMVGMLLVFLKK